MIHCIFLFALKKSSFDLFLSIGNNIIFGACLLAQNSPLQVIGINLHKQIKKWDGFNKVIHSKRGAFPIFYHLYIFSLFVATPPHFFIYWRCKFNQFAMLRPVHLLVFLIFAHPLTKTKQCMTSTWACGWSRLYLRKKIIKQSKDSMHTRATLFSSPS